MLFIILSKMLQNLLSTVFLFCGKDKYHAISEGLWWQWLFCALPMLRWFKMFPGYSSSRAAYCTSEWLGESLCLHWDFCLFSQQWVNTLIENTGNTKLEKVCAGGRALTLLCILTTTTPLGYIKNNFVSLCFLVVYSIKDLHCQIIVHCSEVSFIEDLGTVFVSIDWCVTLSHPVWNSLKSSDSLWRAASLSFNKSSPATLFSTFSLRPESLPL